MKVLRHILLLILISGSPLAFAANNSDGRNTILFYGGALVERLLESGELEARLQLASPATAIHIRGLAWTGDEVGHRLRPEGYASHLKSTLALWPAQTVVVGFGNNEAFAGESGLPQFKKDWGTAEEHLALGIRMSKAIGSRYFRTILGNQSDRLTDGGIDARIADTIQVLLSLRSRAIDSNIKIAVENHAGDMQAWELKGLVEAAGPEYVGVNFDSGNACWSLEDPFHALTLLAPYVLTTSLRDTMVWESATGVTAQWTAMGEGCVDMPALFDLFENKCPGVAVHIETISGFPREFPLFKSDFWKAFPKARAADLAAFMALSKRGRPIDPFKAPENSDRAKAEQDYQLDQISRSIRFCNEKLRLGVRV